MTAKLEVVIADRDADYLGLLMHYVRESDWSELLSVRQLTRPDMLREHRQSRGADIYLIHPDFCIEDGMDGLVILLQETPGEAGGGPADAGELAGIYKYRPLHQLFGQMLELYRSRSNPGEPRPVSGAASVYALYSASGGAGKTTVAVHLLRCLAEKGQRCLYWNMELFPGAAFPQEADVELAARFVYGLRTNADWTDEALPKLLARAEPYGFDYFPGFRKVKESLDLTRDDVASLILRIRAAGRYDVVVIDLESTFHERVVGALAACDIVLWLVTEDKESAAKTSRLLSEMKEGLGGAADHLEKCRFVLNKHTSVLSDTLHRGITGVEGKAIPMTARLPYVSKWKQLHGAERSSSDPLFAERIAEMAELIRPASGGDPVVRTIDSPSASRPSSRHD
jgi:cellulose biosynthesis protein BcsQ